MKLSPISVQILHWNRPEECSQTVRNFLQELPASWIKVIDNNSSSANLKKLRELLPADVALIILPENLGWGGGHNAGLKRWLENETTDFCVVSAHDALPVEDCISKLIKKMQAHPELGMVCPSFPTGEVGVFSPIRGPRVIPCKLGEPDTVCYMDFIHGTLMLFRRECIKQTGLFDERYFAYGDEIDLDLRARKKGWKIGMIWGATVINPGTWVARPVVTYLCTRGTMLLALDHGGHLAAAIRAALIVLNSLKMAFMPTNQRHALCHPKARVAAVRDFYLNRFGAPPPLS